MSPSNHSSRNPAKPAQVGVSSLQHESRSALSNRTDDSTVIDVEGSSGQGPLSGAGVGSGGQAGTGAGGVGSQDLGSRTKRQSARSGPPQVSKSDQPSATSTTHTDTRGSTTTPLGFLAWSLSGIMASLLAYGWGGSFWGSSVPPVTGDQELDDYMASPEGLLVWASNPKASGLFYGWDVKRLLFWSLVFIVFCVIGECPRTQGRSRKPFESRRSDDAFLLSLLVCDSLGVQPERDVVPDVPERTVFSETSARSASPRDGIGICTGKRYGACTGKFRQEQTNWIERRVDSSTVIVNTFSSNNINSISTNIIINVTFITA